MLSGGNGVWAGHHRIDDWAAILLCREQHKPEVLRDLELSQYFGLTPDPTDPGYYHTSRMIAALNATFTAGAVAGCFINAFMVSARLLPGLFLTFMASAILLVENGPSLSGASSLFSVVPCVLAPRIWPCSLAAEWCLASAVASWDAPCRSTRQRCLPQKLAASWYAFA
jgi:hypothetical protein